MKGPFTRRFDPRRHASSSREVYANWLLDACEATMDRMNQFSTALEVEPTLDSYARAGLPASLLAARNHYGEVDLEPFKLNLMQALDIAEGRIEAATTPPPVMTLPEGDDPSEGTMSRRHGLPFQAIEHLDQGEGVDFDTLLKNAVARGFVREVTEAKLDDMLDAGCWTSHDLDGLDSPHLNDFPPTHSSPLTLWKHQGLTMAGMDFFIRPATGTSSSDWVRIANADIKVKMTRR